MGVSEQFVRLGLQQGRFPWGYAVKMHKRYSYYINERRFNEEHSLKGDYGDRDNFAHSGHQRDGFGEQDAPDRGHAGINCMDRDVPAGKQEALE